MIYNKLMLLLLIKTPFSIAFLKLAFNSCLLALHTKVILNKMIEWLRQWSAHRIVLIEYTASNRRRVMFIHYDSDVLKPFTDILLLKCHDNEIRSDISTYEIKAGATRYVASRPERAHVKCFNKLNATCNNEKRMRCSKKGETTWYGVYFAFISLVEFIVSHAEYDRARHLQMSSRRGDDWTSMILHS